MKKKIRHILLWTILFLPYIGLFIVYQWYQDQLINIQKANIILISKESLDLRLLNYKGQELLHVPITVGQNKGNKQEKGDMRTPEGVFKITQIQDSKEWKHDFNDGHGNIKGAYGPYFIRLNIPGHKGIGIHGTHDPESMQKRITEGCIRLKNDDLEKLVPFVSEQTIVIIMPGLKDLEYNNSIGAKL